MTGPELVGEEGSYTNRNNRGSASVVESGLKMVEQGDFCGRIDTGNGIDERC
jgi:hypothetical protein